MARDNLTDYVIADAEESIKELEAPLPEGVEVCQQHEKLARSSARTLKLLIPLYKAYENGGRKKLDQVFKGSPLALLSAWLPVPLLLFLFLVGKGKGWW